MSLTISLITAVANIQNRELIVGYKNKMPWHLKSDLVRFKKLTLNHHIIMGRKTFESLPVPLVGRKIILLTQNKNYKAPHNSPQQPTFTCHTPQDAINFANSQNETELFIGGGSQIYELFFPLTKKIYLTLIHVPESDTSIQGDAYFPRQCWDQLHSPNSPYQLIHQEFINQNPAEKNQFDSTFKIFTR
jgi:dihydrofolate reductase